MKSTQKEEKIILEALHELFCKDSVVQVLLQTTVNFGKPSKNLELNHV